MFWVRLLRLYGENHALQECKWEIPVYKLVDVSGVFSDSFFYLEWLKVYLSIGMEMLVI